MHTSDSNLRTHDMYATSPSFEQVARLVLIRFLQRSTQTDLFQRLIERPPSAIDPLEPWFEQRRDRIGIRRRTEVGSHPDQRVPAERCDRVDQLVDIRREPRPVPLLLLRAEHRL